MLPLLLLLTAAAAAAAEKWPKVSTVVLQKLRRRKKAKVACVAARQPPRLTMREEAAPAPALPAPAEQPAGEALAERVVPMHVLDVPGTAGEVQVHIPVAQEPTAAQARPRRS